MRITEGVFIVYGQDDKGKDAYPYYFTWEIHACVFAVRNEGKIARGLPSVVGESTVYNIDDLDHKSVVQISHRYSEEDIRKIAEDDGSGRYGKRYVK